MRKSCVLFLLGIYMISGAREKCDLSGTGWNLWQDKEATWEGDSLFLPQNITDINELPYNPPTIGWKALFDNPGLAVKVPGTLEEYLTTTQNPQPSDQTGVSWWTRDFKTPDKEFSHALLKFASVRQRAEVFIDSTLVAYDMIGESPFSVDIAPYIKPGSKHKLAVRITHPGGNYHWQDYAPMNWGAYELVPGRGFGGILGDVSIDYVPNAYIQGIYIQNQPNPHQIKAIVSISAEKSATGSVKAEICPIGSDARIAISSKTFKGTDTISFDFDCPDAELWDIENPNLYVCKVSLDNNDQLSERFGFRWFEVDGIGENAILCLNGKRIMLRTAISWGYWPQTGLYPTEEMALKQVKTAKDLGLNMLNFHRCMGYPRVLEIADSLGLLYYEEPGGFHAAADDFTRAQANEKLQRMVRRDRNHPSLIIYNLINEWGGKNARNAELTAKRMDDMRLAHDIDPSRVMTFTSGWAGADYDTEEDAKAHMLPLDTTLYRRGWWDNHRAGGPATWEDKYYDSPTDNVMASANRREIYMRGEEGAISSPPRIALVKEQLDQDTTNGWDRLYWEAQYEEFSKFFEEKDLAPYFGTLDSLTRAIADPAIEHQGKRLQGMRMQDVGDVYVVNGWEAMPYDNHSAIVDIWRNPKGNIRNFTRYSQPAYIAVCPRGQFTVPGQNVGVDFYAVNEKDIHGPHTLVIFANKPDGSISMIDSISVNIAGGDIFGQLLVENFSVPVTEEGMNKISAKLIAQDGAAMMEGDEYVLCVNLAGNLPSANGAMLSTGFDDPIRQYLESTLSCPIPEYSASLPKLDWVAVSRSAFAEPIAIPASAFSDGLHGTYFRDSDIGEHAFDDNVTNVAFTFVEGAQPHPQLAANQGFSIIWKGKIKAPVTGTYMIGASSNRGVRFSFDGVRIFDAWRNKEELLTARPFDLIAGQEYDIEIQYSQPNSDGHVYAVWTMPGQQSVDVDELMTRVKRDGTRLVLLESTETWMPDVAHATGIKYDGFYTVGSNWVGGLHFVKDDSLFASMPVNVGMSWPYQSLLRNGDKRLGLLTHGEDLIVGSYASAPFHVGTAMGRLPFGAGEIIFSTLDFANPVSSTEPSAIVAKRLLLNLLSPHISGNIVTPQ